MNLWILEREDGLREIYATQEGALKAKKAHESAEKRFMVKHTYEIIQYVEKP